MRGKLIQISSQIKNERKAEVQKLTRFISKSHKHKPTPDTLSKLETAQVQRKLALTTATEKHLR